MRKLAWNSCQNFSKFVPNFISHQNFKMYYLAEKLSNFLSHTIYVNINSTPNFLMETLICIVIIFINCLLIAEINEIIKEQIVLSSKTIQMIESLADIKSQCSIYQGVVQTHPDLGVNVVFKENNLFNTDWNVTRAISKLLCTSISKYIISDLKNLKTAPNNQDLLRKIGESSGDFNADIMYKKYNMEELGDSCDDSNTDLVYENVMRGEIGDSCRDINTDPMYEYPFTIPKLQTVSDKLRKTTELKRH